MTHPLDPRRIETEIARVREREASGYGGGVKANLFNLVVADPAGDGGTAIDAALEHLLGRRPARVIRLTAGGGAPAGAIGGGAVVSGRCTPGALDRGVCLEEVEIAAADDPLGPGAAAWVPLLAPDLPVFLWIAGSWSSATLPREACAHVDKLVVDGSRTADPAAAFAALHRLHRSTRGRLAVADLAWSRSLPLRAQAARAFEAPEARPALGHIASVALAGGTPAEALLYFLWLATRLGWTARGGGTAGRRFFRDVAGGEVVAEHGRPAPLARGAALGFGVREGTGPTVSCSEDGCAAIGDDRGPWRVADDAALLTAELDAPRQDPLLAAALAMADEEEARRA